MFLGGFRLTADEMKAHKKGELRYAAWEGRIVRLFVAKTEQEVKTKARRIFHEMIRRARRGRLP